MLAQDKESLVELLLSEAADSPRLHDRLFMEVAKGRPGGVDVATFRAAIDRAVEVEDYDYGGDYAHPSGIDDVIASLEGLLREGHPEIVIDLAEYALSEVEQSLEEIEESWRVDGIFDELARLHLAACRKARPDPEELAGRLLEMELKFEYGYFSDAVDTYSRVLGRTGRAAYKNLAEQKWAQVPALGPGDTGNYERHAITKIMEALARASGDIDELVGVKRHDLSSPHDFLEIAKLYEDADRADETLAWAERGLREFPGRADTALSELAADHYHRRGRHGEAIALAWARFQDV
ncbi:MAG: DUF6880 family protein, partial [Actinomycetota bacterium]